LLIAKYLESTNQLNNKGLDLFFGDLPGTEDITVQDAATALNNLDYSISISGVTTPVLFIFTRNNKKYILDLKWLGQNSKEYQNFNKKLLEVTVNMSKIIRFPQNDISLMVTSVIAVSVNLGDQLLERNDLKPSEVSLFATKLFLKGL